MAASDLTANETAVVCLLADGWRNVRIAFELNMHPRTVDERIASARKKLGAKTTAQLLYILGRDCVLEGSRA